MKNKVENLNTMVIALFRANHSIIEIGDAIALKHNLSVARWKVLGALHRSIFPLTVPQIAREMGLTRQAVQRIIDDLLKQAYVTLQSNPDHKKSSLFALTDKGKGTFHAINKDWEAFADTLIDKIPDIDFKTVAHCLTTLLDTIEKDK